MSVRVYVLHVGFPQHKKYSGGKAEMTIMDAVFMLNNLIDESDPDVSRTHTHHILCLFRQ